jgi:hypothetical protein
MSDETKRTDLTEEELERQRAEQLPDREVMSTIRPWPPLPDVAPDEPIGDVGPEPQPVEQ